MWFPFIVCLKTNLYFNLFLECGQSRSNLVRRAETLDGLEGDFDRVSVLLVVTEVRNRKIGPFLNTSTYQTSASPIFSLFWSYF